MITNAGGMNVDGCVEAIKSWAKEEGLEGYKIGYVTGDDIKDKIPELIKNGWDFPSMDTAGSNDNSVTFKDIQD